MKHSDNLAQKIKQTLDAEVLDEELQNQLKHARRQALDQPQQKAASRYLTPALAFASVCVIAVTISLTITQSDKPEAVDNIDSFDIMTSTDSLEMYENLEFYMWLEQEFNA